MTKIFVKLAITYSLIWNNNKKKELTQIIKIHKPAKKPLQTHVTDRKLELFLKGKSLYHWGGKNEHALIN